MPLQSYIFISFHRLIKVTRPQSLNELQLRDFLKHAGPRVQAENAALGVS